MCASFSASNDLSDHSQRYRIARESQDVFRSSIEATMSGNVEKLRTLLTDFLQKNPHYSSSDFFVGFQSEGRTLLHIAASSGHVAVFDFIIHSCGLQSKAGVVNTQDERGFSALMNATVAESSAIMRKLIALGADVNLRNTDGAAAIHFAAGDGSEERMRLLLDNGAALGLCSKLSGTPLHCAAGKGRADAIRFLLQHGVDPNCGRHGATDDSNSHSSVAPPILMAAAAVSDASVALLVAAGADVGAVVTGNVTVLHICAEHGLRASVAAIVATPTGRKCCSVLTSEGNSPLMLAAMSNHRDIVLLLLPHSPQQQQSAADVDSIMAEGAARMQQWHEQQQQQQQHDSSGGQSDSADGNAVDNVAAAAAVSETAKAQAEEFKLRGNVFFKQSKYAEAINEYSEAIRCHPGEAAYYSNRSAAHLAISNREDALRDAEICRRLRPDWAKGCFRLAAARLALQQFEDAALAAFEGVKMDQNNAELKALLQDCIKQGQEEHRRISKASS